MAYPDQKTMLIEQAHEELKVISTNSQHEFGAKDMEVRTLLREAARVFKKHIDDDYDIAWVV